jgi:hypothetical protein
LEGKEGLHKSSTSAQAAYKAYVEVNLGDHLKVETKAACLQVGSAASYQEYPQRRTLEAQVRCRSPETSARRWGSFPDGNSIGLHKTLDLAGRPMASATLACHAELLHPTGATSAGSHHENYAMTCSFAHRLHSKLVKPFLR